MVKIKQVKVNSMNLMEVMTDERYFKMEKGTVYGNYFFMKVSELRVSDVLDENATIVMIDEE